MRKTPKNGMHASHEDALNNTQLGVYTYYSPSQPEISSRKTENFSVGVFMVKHDGEKRIAAEPVMRISGSTEYPQEVYNKADYAVKRLNESKATGDALDALIKKIEAELDYL